MVATVCYLTEEFCLSTEEAVALVKKERPQINMGYAQLQACKDYAEKYGKKKRSFANEETDNKLDKKEEEKEEKEEKAPLEESKGTDIRVEGDQTEQREEKEISLSK